MPPSRPVLPVLIELDSPPPSPAEADPVPDLLPAGGAVTVAARLAARRGSWLSRLAVWVLGTFGGFVLSVSVWDFVTGLLSRDSLLGTVALVLAGASALILIALAMREAAGFARLARLDTLRDRILRARTAPLAEARAAALAVERLYANRPDLRWPLQRLDERRGDVMDPDAIIALTEAEIMAPLDQAARREIEGAARQVALATALVPLALADVAVALWANLRMVRRLAEIYGGRAGSLGSLRLMRKVFTHLLATGALALTDDMLSSIAGGGLLSKLSRRFGEGLVNAALTARVGVAAMEVCRPMPFAALPRPRVSNLVSRALSGLIPDKAPEKPAPKDT